LKGVGVNRFVVYFIVSIGIVFTGRAMGYAIRPGPPAFDKELWPSRGSGSELVEFFDPACAASRAAHLELSQLVAHVRVRHIQVPVSLAATGRTDSPATPGELLCQLSNDDAFVAAEDSSTNGSRVVSTYRRVRSASECAALNQANVKYIAALLGEHEPSTPVVVLDGVPYRGLSSVRVLSRLLR